MSDLLTSIQAVTIAAENLARACARHSALADATATGNAFVDVLRSRHRVLPMTPTDMLSMLGRIK